MFFKRSHNLRGHLCISRSRELIIDHAYKMAATTAGGADEDSSHFFDSTPAPLDLERVREKVKSFVLHHQDKSNRIALVTVSARNIYCACAMKIKNKRREFFFQWKTTFSMVRFLTLAGPRHSREEERELLILSVSIDMTLISLIQ